MWRYGLDYRHGTGHGIGSYLNVHEGKFYCAIKVNCQFLYQWTTSVSTHMAGPHQISFRPAATNVPLQASMTVTDGKWVLLPLYFELTC